MKIEKMRDCFLLVYFKFFVFMYSHHSRLFVYHFGKCVDSFSDEKANFTELPIRTVFSTSTDLLTRQCPSLLVLV